MTGVPFVDWLEIVLEQLPYGSRVGTRDMRASQRFGVVPRIFSWADVRVWSLGVRVCCRLFRFSG